MLLNTIEDPEMKLNINAYKWIQNYDIPDGIGLCTDSNTIPNIGKIEIIGATILFDQLGARVQEPLTALLDVMVAVNAAYIVSAVVTSEPVSTKSI